MTQFELTNLLDRASRMYYAGKDSGISDTDFDIMLHELEDMEKKNGVVFLNSPTQRVGSDIQDGFKKISHPIPMLTIDNSYDNDGVDKWAKNVLDDNEVMASVKYDGISCEICYHRGYYESASTRGDKMIGDDITENVKTIKSVPLYIPELADYYKFYVRGEVLLEKSRLEEINKERIANGEEPFSNTRNACSGSLKQLDPKITAKRGLIFRAWDCISDDVEFKTMEEKILFLNKIGFFFEEGTIYPAFEYSAEAIEGFHNHIVSLNLDYDFDGVVVKVNNLKRQEYLGISDIRAVPWAIARKWNEDFEATTVLNGVDWQVGRTGVVTPVARLEPVECAGVIVSNATLNNIDFINDLSLHYGDAIRLTRSGGVIPYIISAERRIDGGDAVIAPEVCPVCGEPLVKENVYIRCVNEKCPAKIEGQINYWCSKDCMDIKGIGDAVVHDLVKKNIVSSPLGLYTLIETRNVADVVCWLGDGYGEKSVKKIFEAIDKSRKEKTLDNIIASLGIDEVGKIMGRVLSKHFGSLEALSHATYEELVSIEGIGDVMAKNIVAYFNREDAEDEIWLLKTLGFNIVNKETIEDKPQDLPLNGMTVCFTGKSNRFSGDAVEEFLEANGAKCTHSVSKKMNYLITGEKPGASKVAKANELGVETLTESEFFSKFGL